MRVLHIINSLAGGGAEALTIQLVRYMREQGIETDLLTLSQDDNTLDGIDNMLTLNARNLYSPFLIFRLRKYLREYDIIHAHLFPTQYWVAFASMLLTHQRAKLVMTEHNTFNRRRENPLFSRIDQMIYRKFYKIICISKGTLCELEPRLPKSQRNKLCVIYNGIDISVNAGVNPIPKQILHKHIRPDDFLCVMAARFALEKDHTSLIKSFVGLPEKIKLVLLGEGKEKQAMIDLVHRLNLEKRIFFLGFRKDVHTIISSCDIGVISSQQEAFGLAALDYMVCGKPVIGSDVPGLNEVISNVGLLFPQGNHKKLREQIYSLFCDASLRKKMAAQSSSRISQFDIKRTVEQYVQLYKDIL